MTWHQMMMRCTPDLSVMATYHPNNDLPLLNYFMPSLSLSTTQVKNNTDLFSVPADIHYPAVTFQPALNNLSSYAPFPEAGFPRKNLIGFKVMSTSTRAHLKSHCLSVLLIQSFVKYNMHRQLLLSVYYAHIHIYRTSLFFLISVKHLLLMIS